MGFLSNLFGKKEGQQKAGGMEDFMTLIRVYFQAVMAADLGITNMAALPDLRVFKATLKVPTQNNKPQALQETTGHTDLHVSVLGLHAGPDDAHGQSDEIQAPCAQHLQERHPYDDGENRQRYLHEERFFGRWRHEDRSGYSTVCAEAWILAAVDH